MVGSYENGIHDTVEIAGRNLYTHLDIELQLLAEKLLNKKVGAIVALDPKTGGVLAMATSPNFNPNDLSGAAKQKNYSRLVLDAASPMLNRAIKGRYPPGSTYKPVGALIGLEENVITPASGFDCHGTYYGCNRASNCTEKFAATCV